MQLHLQQQKQIMNRMKKEEEEEEEEALSLSDLPILGAQLPSDRDDGHRLPEPEDFEFSSWATDDPFMCSADDVFFKGQILPLRPSVSSDTGLLLPPCSRPDSQKSSRSGSRSDSMDRSSWGFSSCSSNGSSSSSGGGRKPSAAGANGGGFYSHHPSPKPHLGGAHIRRSACRNGWGRSSWGLFRLGLVQTPEIELAELRRRRSSGGGGVRRVKDGNAASNAGDEGAAKFRWSRGLSCKCSAAAVETVSSRIVVLRGKKGILEEGEGYNGKREISRRRTFEWLRQVSIAEAPLA